MRLWHFLLGLGVLCLVTSLLLQFQPARLFDGRQLLAASYTYLGPDGSAQKQPGLVQVQILVRDSLDPSGPEVTSVAFNNQNVPLQPRDIYDNRGNASFQMEPGTYELRWTVNVRKKVWPRNVTYTHQVEISPRDSWIQISIEGDKASIS